MKKLLILTALLVSSAAPPVLAVPTLTGIELFQSDRDGNANGTIQWNTLGGDTIPDLWVIQGSLGGPFLNGPNDAGADISIPLSPGTYNFTLHGNAGTDVYSYYGLNLFFDGNATVPGISVVNYLSYAPQPLYFGPVGGMTRALNGTPTPGANSLTFVSPDGPTWIQLTAFEWDPTTTNNADRVSDLAAIPDGKKDETGTLTLVVKPATVVTNTLDSGPGSLRSAISFANANPGTAVVFNLPRTDPGFDGTAFTIKPATALPAITADGTVIDGTSQTSFTGDTNTSGPEVVLNGSVGTAAIGIQVLAANCLVRGLVVNGFTTGAGKGIDITGAAATGDRVESCYLGIDAADSTAVPNIVGLALRNGAQTAVIGGGESQRNLISGNQIGILVEDTGTNNNSIARNRVGSFYVAIPNAEGIVVSGGAQNNQINQNDLRSNTSDDIRISGAGTNGNTFISNGIFSCPAFGVIIESGARSNVFQGNSIGGNQADGILVRDNGTTGNNLAGNYFSDNGKLGINLLGGVEDANGVTANNPVYPHSGPNNLQNYPVLTSATIASDGTATITGTLYSDPYTTYTIDFYPNDLADPSGYGEGNGSYGSVAVTTDFKGFASFSAPVSGVGGSVVSSTATAPDGSTSEFSQTVLVALRPPTALSAAGGSGAICLAWTPSAGAYNATYTIKRGTLPGGPYTDIASGMTGSSFTDAGVTSGTTYYYVVSAVSPATTSVVSNEASATPSSPLPAPTSLTASIPGSLQVKLTWTAAPGADAYVVKRSTTAGGPYNTIQSGVTGTTYTDMNVSDSATYYYVVSPTSNCGVGPNSNEASATARQLPAVPTGLAATVGDSKVTLTWNAAARADSYEVKRSTTPGGPYDNIAFPTATTYTDTGLTNGVTYYYVVCGVNAAG